MYVHAVPAIPAVVPAVFPNGDLANLLTKLLAVDKNLLSFSA
jgi:hypothetical protein